jgi:hypothetical protein
MRFWVLPSYKDHGIMTGLQGICALTALQCLFLAHSVTKLPYDSNYLFSTRVLSLLRQQSFCP